MTARVEIAHAPRRGRRGAGAAREPSTRARRARRLVVAGGLAAVVVGAWWHTLSQSLQPTPPPLEMVQRTIDEVGRWAGVGAAETTPYRDADAWAHMAVLAGDTVMMSVLASALAAVGALTTAAFASRALTLGEFAAGNALLRRAVFAASRGLHLVTRSVPELIWALLIVFVLQPGIVAGAVALALHEVGVLGRLASDVIDDVDRGPLRALRSTGAGRVQLFTYGVLPQVLPQLVTFLLYRWEVVVRATVVVGFITGSGLGYQLQQDMARRDWTGVGQVLLVYAVLVVTAEAVAALLRRLAR